MSLRESFAKERGRSGGSKSKGSGSSRSSQGRESGNKPGRRDSAAVARDLRSSRGRETRGGEQVSITQTLAKTLAGGFGKGKSTLAGSIAGAALDLGLQYASSKLLPTRAPTLPGGTLPSLPSTPFMPLPRPVPLPPGPFRPPTMAVPAPTFGDYGGCCPTGYHMAKDGSGRCVRNRRMNVCNISAARRAIRRLKGARKALQRIERAMPKRTVRSRSRGGAHSH